MESGAAIFLNSVRKVCPDLTDSELSEFASKLTFEEFKKKDFFLQCGTVQKSLGFIVNGLVRSSFVDNDGNEITVGFYSDTDYATHYPTFITQQPSKYSIQCLEPTTMVCLSYENLQWIYENLPSVERYGRLVAEEILKRQQARIESFIFQTTEERYIDFIKCHSDLYHRVSVSHLCSFLGTERQTLTRIRQKLAHK
ncbi:Crp/Fnr family transcriptional regulator [Flavobacterium sp. MC2016-06]|jgi:CRP/FNR family transcriptional regulator|uniref:Crp/Fnr family transcriptional regulator n=1 Tax=Flavobacterium sp. MC2016-06 TaxID=2676308 RepID=UPI0012BA9302|nr:Crp/Fnr family transcriptional regulator [Flavobacterium sp. MC2016-06]MBU3857520.1 Crp/Fnr family transcriptional regulator [Flavobacterium sp. MC2016-06]